MPCPKCGHDTAKKDESVDNDIKSKVLESIMDNADKDMSDKLPIKKK